MSDQAPPNTQEVRKAEQPDDAFHSACEESMQSDGEVLLAIREFPSSSYRYFYDRNVVAIEQARLERRGFPSYVKTVMDPKCSKLILVIESNTFAERQVHAEKLSEAREK